MSAVTGLVAATALRFGRPAACAELTRMRTRLADLRHFDSRVTTSDVWTNERIDTLLTDVRDRHLDLDAISEGLYAGGSGTSP